MNKIVIAIDSFKGSLSSAELGKAVEKGIHNIYPECNTVVLPVADGGEGTVESLMTHSDGHIVDVKVHNPLGEIINTQYGISNDTAFMEMAAASGLSLIPYKPGNVMLTNTYGTGEMILDAIKKGCKNFIIGIGGSATNDAGLGMLQALGFRIIDKKGNNINISGNNLTTVHHIDSSNIDKAIKECSFNIITDVKNPFYGENGAAYIFAPQKGANPEIVKHLDDGLQNIASIIKKEKGIDIQKVEGSGAAGGLGGIFHSYLNANLTSGIEFILQFKNFDSIIQNADLIITGEGKLDKQTKSGKAISGIINHANKFNIPVIALSGNTEEADQQILEQGLTAYWSIHKSPVEIEKAMDCEYTAKHIQDTTEQIMRFHKAFVTKSL
ncbi:MAG: glycerate kinase [Parabacteroides sp.]|nr:glycerate kinase [Parabacteroides sp.]